MVPARESPLDQIHTVEEKYLRGSAEVVRLDRHFEAGGRGATGEGHQRRRNRETLTVLQKTVRLLRMRTASID
jgi:hypothetical protein